MKITNTTTIPDLEIFVGQLGVTVRVEMAGGQWYAAIFHPQQGHHVHTACSLMEALDGAFQKLTAAIGAALEATLS